MPAHEATYASREHTPRTVVNVPSFVAYLKQEHDKIVIPLRDREDGAGSSQASDEINKADTARWNRLEDHLDMLTNSPVNKEILEGSDLRDTLHIITTTPAFNKSECKNTAQKLKDRFASPTYTNLAPMGGEPTCLVYGHNKLVPAQSWLKPNPAEAARKAGAHGTPAAGIYGHPLSGVYSLSIKRTENSLNRDEGIKIQYGTRGGEQAEDKNAPPSPNRETYSLRASIRTKIPVRLLRFKPQEEPAGEYGPQEGWRYDGLYKVTEVREAVNRLGGKFEQFTLERLPLDDNMGVPFADCCGVTSSDEEKVEADKEVADAKSERAPHECDYQQHITVDPAMLRAISMVSLAVRWTTGQIGRWRRIPKRMTDQTAPSVMAC